MENYEDIVSTIMEHPLLYHVIRDMPNKDDALNLVRSDWRPVLLNSLRYQDFMENSQKMFSEKMKKGYSDIQRIIIGGSFAVTVVGRFRIVKNLPASKEAGVNSSGSFSLLCLGTADPLDKILEVMTSDLDPSIERNNSHKFYFDTCSSNLCVYCRQARCQMRAKGINIPSTENQSCITRCKVYDGQQVRNTFRSVLDRSGDLLAAVTVYISSRFFYKIEGKSTQVKIGGIVKNIVFFKESALKPTETVDLGDLTDMTFASEEEESTETVQETTVETNLLDTSGVENESYSEAIPTSCIRKRKLSEAQPSSSPTKSEIETTGGMSPENEEGEDHWLTEAIPTSCKNQRTDTVVTSERLEI